MKKADAMLEELAQDKTPPSVALGYFLSLVAGLVGGLVGGYLGWTYDDGIVPVVAGLIGFVVIFCIVFMVSGPGIFHFSKIYKELMPPEWDRVKLSGLQTFDLYVTIHKVQNLYNGDDILGLFSTEGTRRLYVEVKVGRLLNEDENYGFFSVQLNPFKRTCVSASNSFEECFHFTVAPTDNTIRISLFYQDVFADDLAGFCDIDITDQVLQLGFPQKKAYRLFRQKKDQETGHKDADKLAGNIIVSFVPGDNFPTTVAEEIDKSNKLAYQHMIDVRSKLVEKTVDNHGAYGTWSMQSVA